jgi:hypothetical protein
MPAEVYFMYWAHTNGGEEKRFMSDEFCDIGGTMFYDGDFVTIDDYAVEEYYCEEVGC